MILAMDKNTKIESLMLLLLLVSLYYIVFNFFIKKNARELSKDFTQYSQEAESLLQEVIDHEQYASNEHISNMIELLDHKTEDTLAAIKWLTEASSKSKFEYAAFKLANRYMKMFELDSAFKYYNKYKKEVVELGYFYENGWCVKQDLPKAMEYYNNSNYNSWDESIRKMGTQNIRTFTLHVKHNVPTEKSYYSMFKDHGIKCYSILLNYADSLFEAKKIKDAISLANQAWYLSYRYDSYEEPTLAYFASAFACLDPSDKNGKLKELYFLGRAAKCHIDAKIKYNMSSQEERNQADTIAKYELCEVMGKVLDKYPSKPLLTQDVLHTSTSSNIKFTYQRGSVSYKTYKTTTNSRDNEFMYFPFMEPYCKRYLNHKNRYIKETAK